MTTTKMLQLSSKAVCAGIILKGGFCVDAAPIYRWMIGKHERWIRRHCQKHQINVQETSNEQEEKSG